ncbi:MAG: hypothetical protein LQ341_007641, partial [Variospora aurantia]
MEVLHAAPTEGHFTPLSTHQSQTPSSFYSGPPVLHHHSPAASLFIGSSDLKNNTAFASFAPSSEGQSNGTTQDSADGPGNGEDREVRIEGVDVWVTSEYDHPPFLRCNSLYATQALNRDQQISTFLPHPLNG